MQQNVTLKNFSQEELLEKMNRNILSQQDRLKRVSRHELLQSTKALVQEERKITSKLLWHLLEIENRRFYAELGYGSMFEFCTKELLYSASAAMRRINSMRLLREVPSLKEKIEEGKVNLSCAARLQSFFRAERMENKKTYSVQEKDELVQKIENKSQADVDKMLIAISPSLMRSQKQEKIRPVSEEYTKYEFLADATLKEKLTRIQNLISHKNPGGSLKKQIEIMADIVLGKLDPEKKPQKDEASNNEESKSQTLQAQTIKTQTNAQTRSRYIPKSIRSEVKERANSQCEFVSLFTNKRCDAKALLQFEHVKPFAKGGAHGVKNLKIYCRAHNLLTAKQHFGERRTYSK